MSEQSDTPSWWRCDTHGPGTRTAWGCPECVRELRERLAAATRERDEARAEVHRMRAELLRYMGGESDHLYNGDCPDEREHKSRDPNCPACRRMIELAATEAP